MSLKIERLKFIDIPAFVDLWEKFANTFSISLDKERKNLLMRALIFEYNNPNRLILVLKNEDKIIGLASGYLDYDIYTADLVGVGEYLYIEPEYRNDKWAYRMIYILERWGKEKGVKKIRIPCFPGDNRKMWEKKGFTKEYYVMLEKEVD